MMYAIIETGGKQYRVSEGDVVVIEKSTLTKVTLLNLTSLMFKEGNAVFGKPLVAGAKVTAKVEAQGKAKKILVFQHKAKSNYRKRQGHRQPFTKVVIEKIEA